MNEHGIKEGAQKSENHCSFEIQLKRKRWLVQSKLLANRLVDALFVESIYVLSKTEITIEEIKIADRKLKKFVDEFHGPTAQK